jgi:hypothetical protein
VRGATEARLGRGGQGARARLGREEKGEEGEREREVGAHLGAWMIAAIVHRITPRAKEVEERWESGGREVGGGCCARNKMRYRGRGRT